jgi:hypothetical protein
MEFDFTPMSAEQKQAIKMFIALNPEAGKDAIVQKMIKKFSLTPGAAWIIVCRHYNEERTKLSA